MAHNITIKAENKLPDGKLWTNRFQVKSESSNNLYIVAQNKTKRHWGCSCKGWIFHRKCKHLTALGLPSYEQPMEVNVHTMTPVVKELDMEVYDTENVTNY